MAADIKKMIENLLGFHRFDGRTIISVGAGGGQFIEYGRNSKQVIAVDNDADALKKLEAAVQKLNLDDRFTLIHSDFYDLNSKGDVVLFEFCLHEMRDAKAAIDYALTLAGNVVVTDHWPNSEWAYIVDEREKVITSWDAINRFELKKVQRFDSFQFFHDYEELFQKVKVQGDNSVSRIDQYKGKVNFTIPMSYGFALI
jgi:predicted RNA methylase